MDKLNEYILGNDVRAGLIALFFSLLPLVGVPLNSIAGIILAFVTLTKGARSGAVVLAWVTLPALCLLWIHQTGTYDVLWARYMAIWLFAVLLARYASWRLLLECFVVISIVIILGFYLFVPNVHVFWHQYFAHILASIDVSVLPYSSDQILHMVEAFIPYFTGTFVSLQLIPCFIEVLIARWWQLRKIDAKQCASEFAQVRLGQTLLVFLLCMAIGAYFGVTLTKELLPVCLSVFAVAGLSFMHAWSQAKHNIFIVLPIYALMILLFAYVVLLLAIIGIVDTCCNLRQRFCAAA